MNRPTLLLALLLAAACGGNADKPATDAAAASTPAAAPATTSAAVADTGASAAAPGDAATPAVADAGGLNGQTEYAVCAACHQPTGQGLPGAFPPLAGSATLTGDPTLPIAIVLHGLNGPITVKGTTYNGMMMPWNALSDAQIAAILTYERSSWGNSASAVTPEMVAKVRAATKSRTTPWTMDELKKAKLN